MLFNVDFLEAFGQYFNADIQFQIQEIRMLFNTLLFLQFQIFVVSGGESREDKVSFRFEEKCKDKVIVRF